MLVPVGVLILIMLGSVAVDSAIAFDAQRELENQAAAAANDAATVAITPSELQHGVNATVDAALADELARRRVIGTTNTRITSVRTNVETAQVNNVPTQTVTVDAEGDVRYIFAPAIPGLPRTAHVHVRSSAQLHFRQL
jgi:Flp pilus assembly protein TadG